MEGVERVVLPPGTGRERRAEVTPRSTFTRPGVDSETGPSTQMLVVKFTSRKFPHTYKDTHTSPFHTS